MSAFDGQFDEFTGDRFAGFSGDEVLSQDMLREFVTNGAAGDAINFAYDRFTSDPTADRLNPFMNTYDDMVTDFAVQDMYEDAQRAQNRLRRQGAQSQPFGGSRTFLAESVLNDDLLNNIGRVRTDSRARSFDKALENYYGAASGALDAGIRGGNAELGFIDSLRASGSNQRALEQQDLDFAYSEFLREINQGRQDALSLSQMGAAVPIGAFDTSSTQTTKSSDPWGTAIGAGLMAGGLFTGGATSGFGAANAMFGGGNTLAGAVSTARSIGKQGGVVPQGSSLFGGVPGNYGPFNFGGTK